MGNQLIALREMLNLAGYVDPMMFRLFPDGPRWRGEGWISD